MEYKAEYFGVGICYNQQKKLESWKAKLSDAKAELAKLGEWMPQKQQDLNANLCEIDTRSPYPFDDGMLVRSHLKLSDTEKRYLDYESDKARLIIDTDNNSTLYGSFPLRTRTKALLEHKELQTRMIPSLERGIADIEDHAKRFDAYPKFLNEQAKEGWLLFSVVRLGNATAIANDLLLTFQRPTNQGDS